MIGREFYAFDSPLWGRWERCTKKYCFLEVVREITYLPLKLSSIYTEFIEVHCFAWWSDPLLQPADPQEVMENQWKNI